MKKYEVTHEGDKFIIEAETMMQARETFKRDFNAWGILTICEHTNPNKGSR